MRRFVRQFAVAVLAILASSSASAATLQQLTLDQMAQSATAVVRAKVTGSYAAVTGNTIYTHYKLQIEETWKGFPTPEVMVPGGQVQNMRQNFPGMPELKTGGDYVLFLWTSSTTGITHLIGLGQGLFSVTPQADGSFVAERAQLGELMLDAQGRKVADSAVSMKLTDMHSHVTPFAGGAGASRASGVVR